MAGQDAFILALHVVQLQRYLKNCIVCMFYILIYKQSQKEFASHKQNLKSYLNQKSYVWQQGIK